jgi:hypothetical protein
MLNRVLSFSRRQFSTLQTISAQIKSTPPKEVQWQAFEPTITALLQDPSQKHLASLSYIADAFAKHRKGSKEFWQMISLSTLSTLQSHQQEGTQLNTPEQLRPLVFLLKSLDFRHSNKL